MFASACRPPPNNGRHASNHSLLARPRGYACIDQPPTWCVHLHATCGRKEESPAASGPSTQELQSSRIEYIWAITIHHHTTGNRHRSQSFCCFLALHWACPSPFSVPPHALAVGRCACGFVRLRHTALQLHKRHVAQEKRPSRLILVAFAPSAISYPSGDCQPVLAMLNSCQCQSVSSDQKSVLSKSTTNRFAMFAFQPIRIRMRYGVRWINIRQLHKPPRRPPPYTAVSHPSSGNPWATRRKSFVSAR